MTSVLFVCLGNICRSPTAHGVMQHLLQKEGLENKIVIDSCATGAWHIGQGPDERTQKAALAKGYDLSHLRARRLSLDDFSRFDVILAMDTRNLADVIKKAPENFAGKIQLFMDYSPEKHMLDVPDPYYGGSDGFDRVLSLVEGTCVNLLQQLKAEL
jgi:protein-tyrosine phosphatase